MATTKDDKELCTYCGREGADTTDHVIPKNLFAEPKPSNLITVPAHFSCNQETQKDEEYFMAVLHFGPAGVTRVGKKLWEQKLRRTYRKNQGLRAAVVNSFRRVNVMTPMGLYAGTRLGISVDWKRFNRVISKIVRGLYYFEYNEILRSDVGIQVARIHNAQDISDINKDLLPGKPGWPDVFVYRHNRWTRSPWISGWLLLFYGMHLFAALSDDGSSLK